MVSIRVRLEEYASSGIVVDPKDENETSSRIAVRPTNKSRAPHSTSARSASTSHRQNDKYMNAFDTAFKELSMQKMDQVDHDIVSTTLTPSHCTSAAQESQKLAMHTSPDVRKVELSNAWINGPPSRLARSRTLYSKQYGHTEWVTCATYLTDRRIVSGGMDSKLCLWDSKSVKCEEMLGHSGSISCVLNLNDEMIVSTGYDKLMRLWNVGRRVSSRQREISVMRAGTAPILDVSLLFGGQRLVSGDRDGGVQLLDYHANQMVWKHASAHKGHTTSVLGSSSDMFASCFYTGGQDGIVNAWDSRQEKAVLALELHLDSRNHKKGAVSFIREPSEDPNVLVTAGADGVVNVLDKRQSFRIMFSFSEHLDFIYSLHLRGTLCFSGAGNGMLHVHNWETGKLLYGLGANQAAIRAIATSKDQLVAAGDDGGVIVYDMK
ncbi:Cdc4 and related F-box and WD-40 proteins [Plasmopara halstedii]|uniref:Cdc4 and related F-box and WD-40 proteins n=1 Tax=Plasmopara halstedii TaxID=4781 RepID=A0A0P1ABE0_PLAHL|nr:Cdc4 and related F-box and WD-40 proteins [Plasmopara halstedii]CEG38173.1 Cdc4 and related F-box and WD-40 proteins [Plasmopara halstedii]|eukprot:XP_024574542.1 Cdc4 and related F-box and WD-40 proteins [Plasmopara halstedii]